MAAEQTTGKTSIGPEITDVAGEPTEATQLERLIARYHWAASYCEAKTVLEVACGTGQGLGLLRSRAGKVYACDLSLENLHTARHGNGQSQALVQANAQALPFADNSLDAIILLEAIYFLPSASEFLSEARRVLRPGGWCLVSAINKDCIDFNPRHSLYRERYGAPDISRLFHGHGLTPECFGIIPMNQPSLRSRAFGPVKKLAISMDIIPESKRARILLKRIVFGKLKNMPHDISSLSPPVSSPLAIPCDRADTIHQVVLCAGRRQ